MNAYEAAIKTADLFEQKPSLFDFYKAQIPECGAPGCALGYIGHFMGHYGEVNGESAVGIPEEEFYDRMDDLASSTWTMRADLCAVGLRLYAEKYLKP